MDKKPTEDRLYERLSLPIKVNYEVSTRPRDIKRAVSKNVSGGGICLSLPEKLLSDTRLNINIIVPKTKPEDYNIKGRVAWTRRIEITGEGGALLAYYDTGIQFLETNPIVMGKIITYSTAENYKGEPR